MRAERSGVCRTLFPHPPGPSAAVFAFAGLLRRVPEAPLHRARDPVHGTRADDAGLLGRRLDFGRDFAQKLISVAVTASPCSKALRPKRRSAWLRSPGALKLPHVFLGLLRSAIKPVRVAPQIGGKAQQVGLKRQAPCWSSAWASARRRGRAGGGVRAFRPHSGRHAGRVLAARSCARVPLREGNGRQNIATTEDE
jgi:hypothetical protein